VVGVCFLGFGCYHFLLKFSMAVYMSCMSITPSQLMSKLGLCGQYRHGGLCQYWPSAPRFDIKARIMA